MLAAPAALAMTEGCTTSLRLIAKSVSDGPCAGAAGDGAGCGGGGTKGVDSGCYSGISGAEVMAIAAVDTLSAAAAACSDGGADARPSVVTDLVLQLNQLACHASLATT